MTLAALGAASVFFASLVIAPALAQSSPPPIDRAAAVILTRNTLIALNHANQTGNYSVLRDLGAPQFILEKTPADLAQLFKPLRDRQFEMGPIVLFEPVFYPEPKIDKTGMLRLQGYFPTKPLQISFELLYQYVDTRWRLMSISVVANKA